MTASAVHPALQEVVDAIEARSAETRSAYLQNMASQTLDTSRRAKLSCANYAHAFAASPTDDKFQAALERVPNIGIVTSYNDMLSAHQPYERFPEILRAAARSVGATAQVASGVPAMCDGVTQGRAGMELSLFSRDVIALSTAVALSHDAFDAALMLGVCDKIVPGLMIGALTFGYIPTIFVPAGPMDSGISNPEKAKVRTAYARGEIGRDALLDAEMKSYHAAGTCTFYGTANSNQMLMEMMGLHLPGAAFVHPNTPLRDALTREAAIQAAKIAGNRGAPKPMYQVISAKSLVNAVVGLMATGGSTNHALHLPAMAAACGYRLTLEDMDKVSRITPLLARVYPNGVHDVNHFHAAGGIGFVIRELLKTGNLFEDVETVVGHGLSAYAQEPFLDGDKLVWRDGPAKSGDETVLRGVDAPFSHEGGLRLMTGNLGVGISKISAVAAEQRVVIAPAAVFDSQDELQAAFKSGALNGRDLIAVVRFQGPKANGMPELHSLTPPLTILLEAGHKVGLVTDGRMSGASGKVAAAVHMTPEAADGGMLARVQDGDLVMLNCETGEVSVAVDPADLAARTPATAPAPAKGMGRELFSLFRNAVGRADAGASIFS